MTTASDSNQTFRLMPLLGGMLVGVQVGIGAGYGIAAMAGWGLGGAIPALQAGVIWTLSAAFGAIVLLMVSQRRCDRLAFAWLGGSMTRMLMALVFGLFVTLVSGPDLKVFWVCFLTAGLCCLVFETIWAVRVLRGVVPASRAISSGVS